ncbi:MAG: frataxin domain-containing protein, partial [Janthinobacterium sp.]
MSESEFLALAEATLTQIEAALDRLNDEDVLDVECSRSGNVLEIEFIDNGTKIIVNSQA